LDDVRKLFYFASHAVQITKKKINEADVSHRSVRLQGFSLRPEQLEALHLDARLFGGQDPITFSKLMSEAFHEVHIDIRHGAERVEMKGSRDAGDECKDCRDVRNERLRLCHVML